MRKMLRCVCLHPKKRSWIGQNSRLANWKLLRWTMDGKTAWEVGAILGISERTAVLHIQNSMQKLGATSKHQAVLKALRLGLIH